MLKYKIDARWATAKIETVEVVKETDSSVWLKPDPKYINAEPRRSAKKSDWNEYYDTWALAHEALKKKAEIKLISARRALQDAQAVDGNVRGMKEPLDTGTEVATA